MKILILPILFLAVTMASFGQVDKATLTRDLIFDRTALKNLRFSGQAQRLGKSVRVYVGFTLTKQGEYTDVAVVNSGPVEYPFKLEIDRFWGSLPKQDPKYAGRYVAPIAFLLGEGGPDHLKKIANEGDKIVMNGQYKRLDEVPVIGYVLCEKWSLPQQ